MRQMFADFGCDQSIFMQMHGGNGRQSVKCHESTETEDAARMSLKSPIRLDILINRIECNMHESVLNLPEFCEEISLSSI